MKVYQYPRCSTCRKALKWLDEHGVEYASVDIVESPPSTTQLKKALKLSGVPVAKLFNTSGQSYRSGGYKERLPSMSEAEALAELAKDGKLIKRPLLIDGDFALVGFKQEQYESRFG